MKKKAEEAKKKLEKTKLVLLKKNKSIEKRL